MQAISCRNKITPGLSKHSLKIDIISQNSRNLARRILWKRILFMKLFIIGMIYLKKKKLSGYESNRMDEIFSEWNWGKCFYSLVSNLICVTLFLFF